MADPGTQAWLQWLSSMMAGGQPGPPQTLPGATPMTPAGQQLPPGGSGTGSWNPFVSPAAAAEADPLAGAASMSAPTLSQRPPVPPAPVPPAAPFRPPARPVSRPPYVAMPWRAPMGNEIGAPAPAVPPPRPPNLGVPGAPSGGQVPNLGYYAPTTGIAGRGTPLQMDPNDPRRYKGPLTMWGTG